MKITKSNGSTFLTISKSEIKVLAERVVLAKGNAHFMLKTAQAAPVTDTPAATATPSVGTPPSTPAVATPTPAAKKPPNILRLQNWIDSLVKRIYQYKAMLEGEKSVGMTLLKKYPEYKAILPLIENIEKQIETTVTNFSKQTDVLMTNALDNIKV